MAKWDRWYSDHRGQGQHKSGRRSGFGCAVVLLVGGVTALGAAIEVARTLV